MCNRAGSADTSDGEGVGEWGEVIEERSIVDSVEGAGVVPVGWMVVEGGWRRGCECEWTGEEREGVDGGW